MLRRLRRLLSKLPSDEQPTIFAYFYTDGHTIRGFYVGRCKDGYVVRNAEVCPEGDTRWRQLRDTVIIPSCEFFTRDRPPTE
jgi:hypothetical protein